MLKRQKVPRITNLRLQTFLLLNYRLVLPWKSQSICFKFEKFSVEITFLFVPFFGVLTVQNCLKAKFFDLLRYSVPFSFLTIGWFFAPCLHRKLSTCEKNSLEIVSNSLSCLRLLIVGLVQRNLSWLIYLENQNLLPPSLMVWFLTWSTLSESLTQQRRIRLETYLFWSFHHNPDSPSMIDFHPVLNCRLSIRGKPYGCKVVGFFTLYCLFKFFKLCFPLYFISIFKHFFSR